MLSKDIEKEIRSAMEGIKEFKHGVDVIGARLSDIDDRLSEPAYSKEFVDEFKDCCYRLAAPDAYGGISMSDMVCMFKTFGVYKVLEMYSAEEIVKKFRELDDKKKLERDRTFLIGDEVCLIEDPSHTGIVLRDSMPDNNYLTVWFTSGTVSGGMLKMYYEKTGRHFDSIDYWAKTELMKEEK